MIQTKALLSLIKKNALNILFVSFLLVMVFDPAAKGWMLKQLVSIGLFKAEIKKDAVKTAPADLSFSYTDAEGKTASTAAFSGKVVFINFWASWCPPCQAEMPSIEKLYQQLQKDDRFVFLFINEDDDRAKAENFLKKNHYSIPLYMSAGNIPPELFSGSLPTTIVLDKNGNIVFKHEGMAGYDSDDFMKQLKSLL